MLYKFSLLQLSVLHVFAPFKNIKYVISYLKYVPTFLVSKPLFAYHASVKLTFFTLKEGN